MAEIIYLKEVESTNHHLSYLLRKKSLPEGSIVLTDFQSAGKGQANNSWESEKGKNLTFSIVLYPSIITASNQFIISQVISLAIIDSLKDKIKNTSIKWPNDIYVEDKKIGGILIENIIAGNNIESSVIGIGLNVNQTIFHSNAPNPISLKQLINSDSDLKLLLKEIIGNIFVRYNEVFEKPKNIISEKYFSCLYMKDTICRYKSKKEIFKARIKEVKPSGELTLEKIDGGTETYWYKEVKLIID